MYESFYGLKEKPFSMLPDPAFLYLSKKHQKALTLFEYGLMNHAGFSVISGEIGSGKTTILRKLLENMDRNISVGMITNTHNRFGELLDWVLSVYGIHEKDLSEVEKHQCFVDFLIEQYAAKKTTLLIIDEAQNMSADKLEELRMLSNINADKDQVLQVILAGQPELKDTLRLPELKQFVQRVAVDYHLGSLDRPDTGAYIAHRLLVAGTEEVIFTEDACDLIHKYSGGTPRLINLLCDTAMVYGFADQQKVIGEDLVIEMIEERMHGSLVPLACTEPPKKKQRRNISSKSVDDQPVAADADSNIVEQDDADEGEHDFGEKVLRAAASEKKIEVEKYEEPEISVEAKQDEVVERRKTLDPIQENILPAFDEAEKTADLMILSPPVELKRSRMLTPMLMAMSVLVTVTVFYALSLNNDMKTRDTATIDPNKYGNTPESINRVPENMPQNSVPIVPDVIQKQLDEAQTIQQEMVLRQQEASERLETLEEQTILLQQERDKALDNAKMEKVKHSAEIKSARISAKRLKAAEKKAQTAITEAMAAQKKAELLEELRLKEKQEQEAVLAAQQKKLELEEAERVKAEAEKDPVDIRCEGATARFLSTCR